MVKKSQAAALALGAGLVGYAAVGGFGNGGGQGEENAFQPNAPGRGLGRGAGASPFKQAPTTPGNNYDITIEAAEPAQPTEFPTGGGGAPTKKQMRTSGSSSGSGGSTSRADRLTTDRDFGGSDLRNETFNPATSRLKKEIKRDENRYEGEDDLGRLRSDLGNKVGSGL